MARKNKKNTAFEEPTSPAWMTTYGDMMTLLLCFFVLMLSFANVDEEKFSTAMYFLQGALGILPEMDASKENSRLQKMQEIKLEDNVKKIDEISQEMGLQKEITVEITEGGMLIRLGSKILFASGSDRLKKSSYPVLKVVGETISGNLAEVVIGGHTDDIPISSGRYPSNWELSAARAISVAKFMVDSCDVDPTKLVAAGYSEYRPLVPNTNAENRQENRRVEFLISW
jgi:chemotaxis protein MotB